MQISLLIDNSSGILSRVILSFHKFGFNVKNHHKIGTNDPEQSRLNMVVDGNGQSRELAKHLLGLNGVISVLGTDEADSSELAPTTNSTRMSDASSKTLKEECKILMKNFFGEDAATAVDAMSEEECVAKCRARVAGLIGEENAKIFDNLNK